MTSMPLDPAGTTQQVPANRERSHKWRQRLLWVLPSILALYVSCRAANAIWFRTQVPISFANANWSGKWTTQQYWDLSGNLLVRLPDPLPENQDFKAEALVVRLSSIDSSVGPASRRSSSFQTGGTPVPPVNRRLTTH